jgi:hypothetical protein
MKEEITMPDHQLHLDDQIKELVKGGNIEAAVKALYDAIVSAAKNKKFSRSEELLELLYEVDAMALTEIVKAGGFGGLEASIRACSQIQAQTAAPDGPTPVCPGLCIRSPETQSRGFIF